MTSSEIVYKLKNDFPFAVAVIVNNNPNAVTVNLNKVYDRQPENTQALVDLILQFQEAGREEIVANILMVPWIPDNATPEMNRAWENIKAEARQSKGQGAGVMAFSDWSGGMFDALATIGSTAIIYKNQGQPGGTGVYVPPVQQSDNTMLYMIIGVIAVIVILVVIMAIRRK
jgi:hypothetical protein